MDNDKHSDNRSDKPNDKQDDMNDIRRHIERVDAGTVQQAAAYASSIFADVAGRRGAMHGRIAALAPSMRVCGPAFTIEVRAGDNLMIHAAMALAQPGDVLVIDGKADRTCALMGSIMLNACKQLGLAGVVLDASIRDTEELAELGFPVWSVGANPNGPTKFVPGRINWPVSCGGVTVNPGDLIVGDADGITVIEREKVASLLPLAAKKVADERQRIAEITGGGAISPQWLQAALVAAGVLKAGEAL